MIDGMRKQITGFRHNNRRDSARIISDILPRVFPSAVIDLKIKKSLHIQPVAGHKEKIIFISPAIGFRAADSIGIAGCRICHGPVSGGGADG